jgi:pimeloyl-ACP methyl ester carboxylesterase
LVAAGTEDMVIPSVNGERLRARLADAWVAPFAGGGHAFMAQAPVRLAKLIGAFLTRSGPP